MAVLLFFGVLLQSFLATAQDNVSPSNAPWQITGSSAYNAAVDQTIFSYKVTSYSNGFVSYLHVGIPSCPEVKCVGNKQYTLDSQSGIRGFTLNQDVRPGRSWTYTVAVEGMVETGEISYSVGGTRVSNGIQNYHQYSTSTIIGPKCTVIPEISCSISQDVFHGECIGDTVRIPLSTTTQHYTSLRWSTDYLGCSFSQAETANPVITFHGPICDTEFQVHLEVWGPNGQYEKCSTWVAATDSTPPTFGGVWGPQDMTVSCDDIPAPLHVVAKDTCDNDVQVTFSEVEEDVQYGEYSIYRTWIAVDDCDNKATYNQMVVVADREPPTLVGVPDHVTIDCGLDVQPCVVVARDNCDEVTVEREDEVLEGTCVDSWKVIRTWIAEDTSHNAVTAYQTVTVQDDQDPELFGIPDDLNVECHEIPANVVPSALDNCQEDLDISTSERIVPGSCADEYTITRSFSVGDECGNHLTVNWVISVSDTTPPSMSDIVSDHGRQHCDEIPVPCVVDATDNCAVYNQPIVPVVVTDPGSCVNEYVLMYTWTATDNCGNTASKQSNISVYDDSPPKFSVKLPENLRSTCTHAPVVNVQVTDDCGVPSLDYTETPLNSVDYGVLCDYNYMLYRIWTATDECGNSDIMTQTVTVVDDIPPILVGLPPDMTLPCDQPINFDDLSVTGIDNCDCVNAVTRQRTSRKQGTCPDHTVEIYRWSVTDCCGHSVEEFRTVTYYDDTAPRLHGIPGSVYTSIENINSVIIPTVTGTDNCADMIIVIPDSNTVPGTCPHNYKIINTWTAEDDCGNSVSMAQTIYCDDTSPPTFDEHNYDSAVECPLSGFSIITATDNSPIYEVGLEESRETIPGRCEDEYSVLRHFIATDPCGNTAMKTYTVYVYDTQAPEWSTLPHQEDLYIVIDTLDAYNANYVDDVTAYDLCAQEVDVEFEETITQMSCENEYVIRRKWTAADNCGNSVSISRTVDVQDQTPPTLIDVPADASVDCTDDYVNMYASPTAEDYGYSGELVISTRLNSIAGECRNSYTAVKCWTVHDCVGQHDVECQTITITDTDPPSFVYTPPHVTVPCYDIPEPVDLSTAGVDNCGSVVVTRQEAREAGSCENDYLIIHTYTVVDECDLSTTYVHTITVIDEDAPYFDFVPADQSLECGSYSRYVKATCVDTCDYSLEITNDKKTIEGTCEDETIDIRIWVCADDCGNEVTAEQSITFSDIVPPNFNFFPRDLSLPCRDGVSAIPAPPPIRANDNCDSNVNVTLTEHVKPGAYGLQSSTNIRVWIATDNCGNTNEMHQTIIIYDNIAPVVTIPESFELDCKDEYVTPTYTDVTDNCDPAPVVDVTVLNPYALCVHSYIKEYEWCPRDKSGNIGTCKTMRVTVIDTGSPEWTSPLPPSYQKISYTDTWGPASLTANDYCDGNITVTWDMDGSLDMPCPLEERVVYNYHASDICGNTISYSQTIIVVDDVPPPLTPNPENVTVECPAELPSPEVLISEDPYAYEPYRVEFFQQELITSCDQETIVERRWVVKDCAFNVAQWVQTITIQDTTPPSLPQMDDKTLPCEEDEYVGIEAYDDCDNYVDVQFLTDTVEDGCSSTVYRHWIATDDCGNVDNEYQTIYIYDDENPQLYGAPLNVTVDNHNVPGSYVLQCSDNCVNDMFSAEFEETTEAGSCDHEWTIKRKWTCTDECGQSQVSIQIVNVIDSEVPEISYCPSDITVQLGLVPPPPTLTAVDAQVYGDVPVFYNEYEEVAYQQEIMQILYRSWTATDECNNIASCEQTVTVIDTVPPIIPDVPRDTYLDCDDIIVSSQEEWDNAYAAITTLLQNSIASVEQVDITPNSPPYPFEKIPGTCRGEYTVKRTWTATDHAGNSLSDTQVLQIIDDQPPVFSWDCQHEPSLYAECEHDPPCNPTVTDNCDDFVFPNLHEKRIKGTCPNEYTLIRLWDARDSCGNTVSAKQTVYVGDSNPPVLSDGPDDETYECTFYTTLPTPAELTCTDECDGDIDVKFHSTKHLGECADSWVILRTWTCADICGHEVHYTQTIMTNDTTKPEFDQNSYDGDVTIPCEQDPPPTTPTATDNCAEYVQVHSEFVGYTIGYIQSTFVQLWTAYDNCGNYETKERTITVEDLIDPVISPRPPSQVIPCNQYSAFEMPEPHCDDNCGIATITRNINTILGTCESEYELEVQWTCVDQHDNTNDHTMVISVVDNESPVIDVKGFEIEAPCNDVPPAPTATASDNCDYVTVDYSENTNYPEYILGSFASPLDFANVPLSNVGSYMPDYYSISPMVIHSYKIARGSGMHITLSHCDWKCMMDDKCFGAQLWSPTGEAPFRCYLYDQAHICEVQQEGYKIPDTQSDVTYRSNTGNWIIKGDGVCTVVPEPVHLCDRYNLVRRWTAEDLCGNQAEVVQSIRVWDDTPPVWDVVPNDVTEDCTAQYNALPECDGSDPDLAACHGIRAPEATDDCTFKLSVTETYSSQPGNCDTNYVGTYTWTVADTCGNVATAKVKVTKLDDTPPTIAYVSPDEDVECVNPLIPPTDPDCTDDCNNVTVTVTSKAHSGTCDYQLIYVWTCTDDCGNSATTQQRLNIADTTPPTLDSVPDDETFPCETPVLTADDFDITCSDVCGSCTISKSVTTSTLDCPNNVQHIWRFVASDDCGNRVEAWTTLTYLDLVPPNLTGVPDDYTVNCSVSYDDIPVSCTDECGTCTVKYSESSVDYDCESTSMYQIIYRSWTATDLCGHVSVASQTVTVTDGSFPVINKPDDRTIECDDQIPAVTANANDDCGMVTISDYSTTVDGTCEDEYKIVKTWLAIDLCGNKQYESYTLTVQDTQDPEINGVPANATVSCDQIPDVPTVVITDDCSYPAQQFDETSDRDGYGCNQYEIVRTWSGHDDCGNSVSGSYTISVTDSEAPTLTCNGADTCEDVAIECEIYPALPTVVAHDNCYEHLEVTYNAVPDSGSCVHDHQEFRQWTTEDGCGFQAEVSQTITYYDNTPPVLEGLVKDVTVECPNTVPVPPVTSNDNCDYALSVHYTDDQVPGPCKGVYIEYRRWTSEDLCGNTDWIAQTVTVEDHTPPSLDVYASHAKVECDRLADAWHGEVTASDDCDYDMTVKFTEEKFDGTCLDTFTLVRRWFTADCSGNTATHVQTVYVQDTLPPYFLGTVPQDITVSQGDVYSGGVILDPPSYEADDNCADPVVQFSEVEVPMDYECDYMYYIIRTWSVEDDCGNTASMTQTIDMVQTEAPMLTQPEDVTVECDSVPPPCDVSIIGDSYQATLTFFESKEDGSCENEYEIIRTWTATDCAYNSGSVTQTVTVHDWTPPTFTRIPADVLGECDCDDVFTVPVLDFVDNCGLGTETEVFQSTDPIDGTCDHAYSFQRIWTIEDECGNENSITQNVTVVDTTPPVFCDCPNDYANVEFECDEVPVLDPPSVMDNCDDDLGPLSESHSQFINDDNSCESTGYYAYSWSSYDDCGNYDECLSTIRVVDNKPPHIVNGDQFCYPLNGYGPTANEWAVYDINDIVTCADTCDDFPTVVFVNCTYDNNPSECQDLTTDSRKLYVHMVVSLPEEEYSGRYYTVWFETSDNCGNSALVKRVIWVPATPFSYEEAVNRGLCPHGIGTNTFEAELPVIST